MGPWEFPRTPLNTTVLRSSLAVDPYVYIPLVRNSEKEELVWHSEPPLEYSASIKIIFSKNFW